MRRTMLVLLTLWIALPGYAQQQPTPQLEKVRGDIYMISAAGGNIGVLVGEDGAFMIDDQFAPLTPAILEAIATVTDQPVKFVINTHWHGDHTGGNENLGKAGAIIVAHDNVYERLSTQQIRILSGRTYDPKPKDALPVITFNRRATFHLNGHTIRALHVEHAHTDGDTVLFFEEANVVHTGDLFFQSGFPFLDVETGASINGALDALDLVLNRIDEQTLIIPGHGVVSRKKDLAEYRNVLVAVKDAVQRGIDLGKTLEQIQAEKPLAEYDERWGSGFISSDRILELVYLSLTDERFNYEQ